MVGLKKLTELEFYRRSNPESSPALSRGPAGDFSKMTLTPRG
jgi:hypothetical protein